MNNNNNSIENVNSDSTFGFHDCNRYDYHDYNIIAHIN